jgi:hypothetical protein
MLDTKGSVAEHLTGTFEALGSIATTITTTTKKEIAYVLAISFLDIDTKELKIGTQTLVCITSTIHCSQKVETT